MVDFTHAPPAPTAMPVNRPIHSEEDLTHLRRGPLGDMAVVPDNYVGPMPAGAVRETDYQRMASVYTRIDSGKSSIQFDTSNYLKTEDGKDLSLLDDPRAYMNKLAEAQAFRAQYMGYIQDLVKTPAGLQLLERLDQSKLKTNIKAAPGGGNGAVSDDWDATHRDAQGNLGKGTGTTVTADPTATDWEDCGGQQPWMVDRPRFGFYHELVHAYHNNRGDAAQGGGSFAQCTDFSNEIGDWEFQAAGIGPYRAEAVSENAIRAQMGVPERPTYGGATYHAPNPWAQVKDDEEPPVRSPRR